MGMMTVTEVCDELRISPSTWAKWRARRIGPAVVRLPNGGVRVRRTDLEAWLTEQVSA